LADEHRTIMEWSDSKRSSEDSNGLLQSIKCPFLLQEISQMNHMLDNKIKFLV